MSTPQTYPAGTTLDANIGLEWSKESGEVQVYTYEGGKDEIDSLYAVQKALAAGYGVSNLASIQKENARGRSRLVMRFVRETQDVEELYAVDVVRDIREADYFAALTDKEVVAVKRWHEEQGSNPGDTPASWSTLQVTLYKHLAHGADTFIDKQFVLRTSTFTSVASLIAADFGDLGRVVATPPTLSADMQRLIASLPTGEWLQGPQQAECLGRGRWRLDNELQWALKWSVIYGGTLYAP